MISRIRAAGAAFLMAAASLSAQPLPGALLSTADLGRRSVSQIRELATPMFSVYEVPPLPYDATLIRIRYQSRDFDGSMAPAEATVFVPEMPDRPGVPLLVFGSGTTGVSNACAPSLEQPQVRRWGHYQANMLAYAANGIVTVFPDYLGFNDPSRPQRYFSKQAEAHLMLDAVRAVRQLFEERNLSVELNESVFLAGYSQGGHAALSAADLMESYAPEVALSGVVSYGGTMNVETLLREGPYYAPYIFYTYQQMYGVDVIDPSEYLQDRFAETLEEDVLRMCVDQFQVYYPFDGTRLYRPEFHEALMSDRLSQEYPALKRVLDENLAGLSGHGVPALIVQGEDDIIITTSQQEIYARDLCESGSPVEYLVLEDVRHRFTRAAGFRATLAWMQAVASGASPSDCLGIGGSR